MKRQGNVFPLIVEYQNLRLAWLKALHGKRKSAAVLLFGRNTIHEAKTQLSRLIQKVLEGEEVIIADDFDEALPDFAEYQ